MTERNAASNLNGGSSYLLGDSDPANFDYHNKLSNADLLKLFLRNPKIQKATAWYAGEVLRERWEWDQEQPILGKKFGQEYQFKTFNDWLEWNGFFEEALKALTWSLLFGDAIIVFYDNMEMESAKKYKNGNKDFFGPLTDKALVCKAFYPSSGGSGFTIEEVDPYFGKPQTYKIQLHAHRASKSVEYYVDASRVVRFHAPQKQLKYEGTSAVTAIAHDCLVQEQIKRSVMVQANNVQSGILALKAANEDEKTIIDSQIGDSFSYLRRVYFKNPEELDNLFKLMVPDLKIDQFMKLNDIIQQEIATGMDMSRSVLEGSPQGTISSAGFDTFNTYAKVKQYQSHYKRAFEECFYLFGKEDTSFIWNDPTPTEEDVKDDRGRGTEGTFGRDQPIERDSQETEEDDQGTPE